VGGTIVRALSVSGVKLSSDVDEAGTIAFEEVIVVVAL
jgi:hypothetical protein